jgi:hypothetical protein
MNDLAPELTKGTVGELLVQLRLLQYRVQAAPPLRDTGNDLVGVRGKEIRTLQVKTTAGNAFALDLQKLREYHVLVLVQLIGENYDLRLDECRIFLLLKSEVKKWTYSVAELGPHLVSSAIVDKCFGELPASVVA